MFTVRPRYALLLCAGLGLFVASSAFATEPCSLACSVCDEVSEWTVPVDGAVDVPTNVRLAVMAPAAQTFELSDPSGQAVSLEEVENEGLPLRIFAVVEPLIPQTTYRFRSTLYRSFDGADDAWITFTTGDGPDVAVPSTPSVASVGPGMDGVTCTDHVGLNLTFDDGLPPQSLLRVSFTATGSAPVEAYVPAMSLDTVGLGFGVYLAYRSGWRVENECMFDVPELQPDVSYQLTLSLVSATGEVSPPSTSVTATPTWARKTSEQYGACGCAGAPSPSTWLTLWFLGLLAALSGRRWMLRRSVSNGSFRP